MIQASSSVVSYMIDEISSKTTNHGQSGTSKARDAATQFEAILITSLLEKFDSMAESPGDASSDAGGSTMHAIGVQALASKLSESGGLGIAKMLMDQLDRGAAKFDLGTKV